MCTTQTRLRATRPSGQLNQKSRHEGLLAVTSWPTTAASEHVPHGTPLSPCRPPPCSLWMAPQSARQDCIHSLPCQASHAPEHVVLACLAFRTPSPQGPALVGGPWPLQPPSLLHCRLVSTLPSPEMSPPPNIFLTLQKLCAHAFRSVNPPQTTPGCILACLG